MKKLFNNQTQFARDVFVLAGRLVVYSCVGAVTTGIFLGVAEIVFALSLEKFLTSYGLLANSNDFVSWLPEKTNPLVLLIVIAAVIAALRYSSMFIPFVMKMLFLRRIQRLVTREGMQGGSEISALSVGNVTNILANLAPGASNLLLSMAAGLISIVRLLVLLVGIFSLSSELSLIALILIVVFGAPTIILRRSFTKLSTSGYKATADYTQGIIKGLRNVVFLKLSGKVDSERERLESYISRAFKFPTIFNSIVYGTLVWPGLLSILVVILIVVINYNNDFIPDAALVPFIYLLSRIAAVIGDLTLNYGNYQLSKPQVLALIKYNPILFSKRLLSNDSNKANILEPRTFAAQDLSIGRNEVLLQGISINLSQGDLLLIKGKSGVGKTTLLYTILGLIRPKKGRVLWNEIDIGEVNLKSLNDHLSYSGSDPYLFDATIEENLRFGQSQKSSTSVNIKKVLEIVDCSFINDLEGKLSYVLKEGGEGISAGQKQRISLARALLREPKVLLLDEATSNIDIETEKKIFKNIRNNYPDMMIISIAHRDTALEFASKVIDLNYSRW